MVDAFIAEFDKILRTLFVRQRSVRATPGDSELATDLSEREKSHVGALMRINHVGEICAQALYHGQAIACREPEIRQALENAAKEETEHLAWTEQRLGEVGARKSLLNPLWYLGAFSMGVVAGRLGSGWNLGFLAETERQVEAHLAGHLSALPAQDKRSQAIVGQMKEDERRHAEMAVRLGARELPPPVRVAMKVSARVMTSTAYYL